MIPNSKITICFVSYREPFEVVLEDFSKAIAEKNNYELTLLGRGDKYVEPFFDDKKRKVVTLELPTTKNHNTQKFFFALQVAKYLKRNKFSIIHMDISCRYFGLIKLLSRSNAKFIFHILSYPVSNSKFTRFKKMIRIYLQCLLVDKVIIQSSEIKERWIGIKNLKYTAVIPVGFDKSSFFPIDSSIKNQIRNQLSILENNPLLVYSGVISKQRNIDKLVLSMSIVHKFNKDVKLLLVGSGKAINALKSYAKSLDIEESLIFVGYVSHNKVMQYLNISDIAISYVPVNEGYNYNPPLKTYEYLACGLPTIATNTLSNQKIINNGENGILVNDTSEEIADAIIDLLSNPSKCENLRKYARNSIMNYDYQFLGAKYLIPLYEDLLTQ